MNLNGYVFKSNAKAGVWSQDLDFRYSEVKQILMRRDFINVTTVVKRQ